MSQYDLILERIITHSGCFYEMEEKMRKTLLFALSLSNQFHHKFLEDEINNKTTIQKTKLLRHYLRCLDLNKKYYIFDFVQGHPISKVIKIYGAKQESMPIEKIHNYLKQLLEALHQLHKLNILGRVFSTENIIELQDNSITLMDFGFGPELKQAQFNLLAPPEIVQNFEDNIGQGLQYGIEIDSWLLGAFLYHLVTLKPINLVQENNQLKAYTYSQLRQYNSFIQYQMKKSKNIKVESSYPIELNQFIESLLRYDSKERLSFLNIYQSQYIQKVLRLRNCDELIQFYSNLNLTLIQEKILLREGVDSNKFLQTSDLQQISSPKSFLEQCQLNPDFDSNLKYFELQCSIPRNLQIQSVVPQVSQYDDRKNSYLLELPLRMQNGLSKFEKIFKIINLEQFRFVILINTAEEVVLLLSDKQFGQLNAIEYFFKKMAYLIMIEILEKLNSENSQWTSTQEEWQDFQKLDAKLTLIQKITSNIEEILIKLKNLHQICYTALTQNELIDENIRQSVEQDQHIQQYFWLYFIRIFKERFQKYDLIFIQLFSFKQI
ncbi:unnamed protein product (macronuclear) [Paramecium tetraurelia]|uniref:non-specific serine/threonine protein kinase n=1 Tax=Paramecium tetraurelia TaxID=5888 RepID=A0D1Z7_PARTE|nr:uncharacterized protein GSPATT00012570001 [Paramecium tetraurelia]CAK77064.1 unnamed protein product [Paramecium tetraurelia]|eukprot:XP_001444461.1 hypothetical protein (macronuclear) [Paramecium tetraurelia strain d4-2]